MRRTCRSLGNTLQCINPALILHLNRSKSQSPHNDQGASPSGPLAVLTSPIWVTALRPTHFAPARTPLPCFCLRTPAFPVSSPRAYQACSWPWSCLTCHLFIETFSSHPVKGWVYVLSLLRSIFLPTTDGHCAHCVSYWLIVLNGSLPPLKHKFHGGGPPAGSCLTWSPLLRTVFAIESYQIFIEWWSMAVNSVQGHYHWKNPAVGYSFHWDDHSLDTEVSNSSA